MRCGVGAFPLANLFRHRYETASKTSGFLLNGSQVDNLGANRHHGPLSQG